MSDDMIKVEGSTELAPVDSNIQGIRGLEDVPRNIIPLPYYKLVQPGSTNVETNEGEDAQAGSFLMRDIGKSVSELQMIILRAKRQVDEYEAELVGPKKRVVSLGIVGADLTRDMKPFMMKLPVSSFSNFGRLVSQMQEKNVENVWDYPVTVRTEKVETQKQTDRGMQQVKFWIANFELIDTKLTKKQLQQAEEAYAEFATHLDRNSNEDETEIDDIIK